MRDKKQEEIKVQLALVLWTLAASVLIQSIYDILTVSLLPIYVAIIIDLPIISILMLFLMKRKNV